MTTAAINNGSSDPDGIIVGLSLSKTSFNCSNIGPNTVTLTVTDKDGATTSCNATVTVQNNSAPSTVCQNITVQLNAAGTASISAAQIDGGSTDNCGSPTLTAVPNTFTCTNVGQNNVTLVLDKYGKASVSMAMIDNGSTDNCTIVTMWLEGLTEYDCGSSGVHEVVLKASD